MDRTTTQWQHKLANFFTRYEKSKTSDNFVHFSAAYFELVNAAVEQPSPELKRLAMEYFTPVCNGYALLGEDMHIVTVIDLLTFIYKKDHIALIEKSEEGSAALAWFSCFVSANSFSEQNPLDDDMSDEDVKAYYDFLKLLNNWTGSIDTKTFKPSLDNVVKVLYGEPTWDLLGINLEDTSNPLAITEAADAITQMNLPLQFKKQPAPLEIRSPPQDLAV